MVEYQGAEANTVGTNDGSAGFSLWRAIVYGLALSGLAYALNAVQHASPEQIAYVLGYLGVGPLIFVTIGAFLNLFSGRKVGPSLAALLIVAGIVVAVIGAVNGWFDKFVHG
jgi:hypothetical protein